MCLVLLFVAGENVALSRRVVCAAALSLSRLSVSLLSHDIINFMQFCVPRFLIVSARSPFCADMTRYVCMRVSPRTFFFAPEARSGGVVEPGEGSGNRPSLRTRPQIDSLSSRPPK